MSFKEQELETIGSPDLSRAAEPAPAAEAPVELDISEIAKVAHTIWLASGRAEGRDVENWYAAIEIVRARASR